MSRRHVDDSVEVSADDSVEVFADDSVEVSVDGSVEGHGFSRAVDDIKPRGLQPLRDIRLPFIYETAPRFGDRREIPKFPSSEKPRKLCTFPPANFAAHRFPQPLLSNSCDI